MSLGRNGVRRPGAARMRDVAEAAQVSTMTVSRALTPPTKVSPEVRARVAEAVRMVGYVPNKLAGSLSSNRSKVIGLVVPSIVNSLFAATIQGISDVLRRHDHQLMIADSGYSLAAEETAICAFLEQRVAGLILHDTTHTPNAVLMIRASGVPVVENGTLTPDPLDMVVSYSNADAARAMTLHLVRLGYRRIGFVSLHAAANARSRDRQRGYRAALEEAGLGFEPGLMLERPPPRLRRRSAGATGGQRRSGRCRLLRRRRPGHGRLPGMRQTGLGRAPARGNCRFRQF